MKNIEFLFFFLLLISSKPAFSNSVSFQPLNISLFDQESYPNSDSTALADYQTGKQFFQQSLYPEALHYYLKALSVLEENGGSSDLLATLYDELGDLYYQIHQPSDAYVSYRKAEQMFEELGNLSGLALALNGLGHLYEKQEAYDSAIYFQERALSIIQQENNPLVYQRILESLGSIYEDLNVYDSALHYFKEASIIPIDSISFPSKISIYNNIGDIFRKTARYDSSFFYTSMALALARSTGERYQESSALKDLAKLSQMQKDYEAAYEYLEEGRRVYQEVYSKDVLDQIGQLKTFYEVEKRDTEIALLKQQQTLDLYWKTILSLAFISLSVFSIMVYLLLRYRFRKQKQLLSAKLELEHQSLENIKLREKQLELEIALEKQQKESLKNDLDQQAKLLTTTTLEIIEKNTETNKIIRFLEQIKESTRPLTKREFNRIIKDLEKSLENGKHWEEFDLAFGTIHTSFFHELKRNSPQLTDYDLRLAALIKVKLTSMEIANSLGISTDSLRISKHRLKKKLGLGAEVKLSEYIESIA